MKKENKNIVLNMIERGCAVTACKVFECVCAGMRLGLLIFLLIGGGAMSWAAELSGNQLIMVTASNCPWCESFEDEVGAGYPKTAEAKVLPLRRHDIYDAIPADMASLVPATMTPTFIIIRDGAEVGRIVGYPGAELFWWRLSEFTK
jgi:hypothetical protein